MLAYKVNKGRRTTKAVSVHVIDRDDDGKISLIEVQKGISASRLPQILTVPVIPGDVEQVSSYHIAKPGLYWPVFGLREGTRIFERIRI